MHTTRALTIFPGSLDADPQPSVGRSPEGRPHREQTPPKRADPPVDRVSDTRLWKHNLRSLRYAGGNNILPEEIFLVEKIFSVRLLPLGRVHNVWISVSCRYESSNWVSATILGHFISTTEVATVKSCFVFQSCCKEPSAIFSSPCEIRPQVQNSKYGHILLK